MNRSVYAWLASGLLLGSILVLWVLMTTPQSAADTIAYASVGSGFVLAAGSFFAFLGIELRRAAARRFPDSRGVSQAVRQGIELAVFLLVWALLRIYTNLNGWETALLCVAAVSAEVAVSLRRQPVGAEA